MKIYSAQLKGTTTVATGSNVSLTGSFTGSIYGFNDTVQYSSSVDSRIIVNTNRLNNIESKSASVDISISNINSVTSSFSPRVSNLESKSASVDISISNINSVTSSFSPRVLNLESKSASVDISISNINAVTASNIARLSNLETKSSSVDISITNINSFTASNGNTSLNSKTGSYATTGSNTFFGTQTYSGSVYIANDLVVQGSSSIQYISASSVSIGTNIVRLNTANPSVRFAGLTMIDSGSVGGSGSFLYDSVEDEFIFVHRGNGTNVTSSHFVTGPETYDSLGNELYLTCNVLTKGTGKEHLVDSCIFDNGTTTCIKNNLITTGTLNGTSGNFSSFVYVGNGNPLRIYNTGNGDYGNLTFATATGFTFDKTLTSTGGTFSGQLNVCYASYPEQRITDGTIGYQMYSSTGASDFVVGTYTNHNLIFRTNQVTRLSITNAGTSVFAGQVCAPTIITSTCLAVRAGTATVVINAIAGAASNNHLTLQRNDTQYASVGLNASDNFTIFGTSTSCPRLTIDTSGNLTIGTNFQIDAAGDFYQKTTGAGQISVAIANTTYPTYGFYGNTGVGMYRESADTLAFTTCATKRLTITSAGIVQIGSTAGSSGMFLTTGNAGITCNNTYFGTGQVRIGGGFDAGANTVLSIAPGVVMVDAPGVSGGRFKLSEAGTLGINCTGVAARTMVVKGASGCYIVAEFIEPAGVHSILLYPNKNSTNHISSDYMSGGAYLPLSLSGRECTTDLVLGTNGRVGIGSGANYGILTVYDSGCTTSLGISSFCNQAKGIEIYNANSGTTDNVVGLWISTGPHKAGIASGRTDAAANWAVDLRFYTHPTTIGTLDGSCENMRLDGQGALVTRAGHSSPGLYSDINLKENLSIIPSALNKIQCINGYTFDWKDTAPARSNPDLLNIIHDAGLIAQEVESILPDIVRENSLSCIKMLNYNGVIALLVEGMKEQQCTINLLKTCIGIV